MYIDTAKSTRGGRTYIRHLRRDSYRADGKVKHRTIANLGDGSEAEIAAMKLALKHKGCLSILSSTNDVHLEQGKRFGAVWQWHQLAGRLGLAMALGCHEQGKIALFQVIARAIAQGSRLSVLRMSASHAVDEMLGIESVSKDQLYRNLTWLSQHQESIEKALWKIRCKKNNSTPHLY